VKILGLYAGAAVTWQHTLPGKIDMIYLKPSLKNEERRLCRGLRDPRYSQRSLLAPALPNHI